MNRRVLVPGFGRLVGLVVAAVAIAAQLVVIAAGAWAVTNRGIVRDWLVVGKVIETETLASYVDDAGLSEQGRFYLYAAKPILHTVDTFNEACPAKEQGIAVLGCYIGKDDRIHLLDITDETFSVMEPVVAAHEMLHAVWARFDDAERERVGAAVELRQDRFGVGGILPALGVVPVVDYRDDRLETGRLARAYGAPVGGHHGIGPVAHVGGLELDDGARLLGNARVIAQGERHRGDAEAGGVGNIANGDVAHGVCGKLPSGQEYLRQGYFEIPAKMSTC